MIVLLDSNIFFSALISPIGAPRAIYDAWLRGRFRLVTCRQQIDETRIASRNTKMRTLLHPNEVGAMLNHLHGAEVWEGSLPRKHAGRRPGRQLLVGLDGSGAARLCRHRG